MWTTQHICDSLCDGPYLWQANATETFVSTALMVAVVVLNTIVCLDEIWDLCVEGPRSYCNSGWNLLDMGGVIALYASVSAYMVGTYSVLAYSGALGVLFNSFSILQLLRPFHLTGPVIKMATTIISNRDIEGFLCVSLLLLVGFSAAFAVCMPESRIFGFRESNPGGPAHGFLIVFQSMLGAFDVENYTHPAGIVMFVSFAFVMVLVLLNLLIAMASTARLCICKAHARLELTLCACAVFVFR
jgi:hypothetical protein